MYLMLIQTVKLKLESDMSLERYRVKFGLLLLTRNLMIIFVYHRLF